MLFVLLLFSGNMYKENCGGLWIEYTSCENVILEFEILIISF